MKIRGRDYAVMLLGIIALFLSVQPDSNILDVKPSFFCPLKASRNPGLLVKFVDVNGDGSPEIIVADPSSLHLTVYYTSVLRLFSTEEFESLPIFAETTLLIESESKENRVPLALDVGHMFGSDEDSCVIVLFHDNGDVVLYDGKTLELIWMTRIKEMDESLHSPVVTIFPQRIRKHDEGIVVVSFTAMEEQHEGGMVVHTQYFALDGKTGTVRWIHTASALEEENTEEARDVGRVKNRIPWIHSKHVGEVSWRQYRASLEKHFPHRWSNPMDTKLSSDHFSRRLGGTNLKPNVIVAHVESGIEVIHLFTGRSLCHVPLSKFNTHMEVPSGGTLRGTQPSSVGDSHELHTVLLRHHPEVIVEGNDKGRLTFIDATTNEALRKVDVVLDEERKGSEYNTLTTYRPYEYGWEEFALFSGNGVLSFVSSEGIIEGQIRVTQSPISAPIVADVGGKGAASVVVPTAKGIFGYSVTLRAWEAGGFSVLVLLVAVGIIFLFISRFTSDGSNMKRSTD